MNKLIHNKIKDSIRYLKYGLNKKDLFSNLQGFINAMLETNNINYNQYRRYLKYVNYKFI